MDGSGHPLRCGSAPAGATAPASAGAHWLALAVAIAASQAGQLLLKLGATGLPAVDDPFGGFLAQLLRWQTLVGLCSYGGGTMFYVAALRGIPMSVALPCTAASYVAATAFGTALFGESLSPLKVAGLLLVCAGVAVLAAAETSGGDKAAGALPPEGVA